MRKRKKKLTDAQIEKIIQVESEFKNTLRIGDAFRNAFPFIDTIVDNAPPLKAIKGNEQIKNLMVGTMFNIFIETMAGKKVKVENIKFSKEDEISQE